MAFIQLKTPVQGRRSAFVTAEQGLQIWRVLVGEIKGTPKQRAFVRNVQGVYLNRSAAPRRYSEWMDRRASLREAKRTATKQLGLDNRVLQYKD